MPGSNANFRNTATDKDYTLRKDAGHLSAAVFSKANPQQGLNSIACGETKQDSLTETTFKAAFRFDDLVANQRYYSVLFTFREDVANPDVKVFVRSTSFKPWVTVWRNATHKFQINPELSSDSELVVPVDVTSELTGPFIIEVSSENPYTTGDFEVELRCTGTNPLTGFIYPGVRDYGYTFDIFAFSGTIVIIPPTRGFTVFHYSFASDYGLVGYTWTVVSGSLGGLALSSFGILDGTVTQTPDWATFPLDGKFPWPARPGIAAHTDWVDSMYSAPWRGFARNGGVTAGPFMNIHFVANILTTGASPPIGNRVISVPILVDQVYATFSVVMPTSGSFDIRPAIFPPEIAVTLSETDTPLSYALVSQVDSVIGFMYSKVVNGVGVYIGFTPGFGWNAVIAVPCCVAGFAGSPTYLTVLYFRTSGYNAMFGSFSLAYIGMESLYTPGTVVANGTTYLDPANTPPTFDDFGDLVVGANTTITAT